MTQHTNIVLPDINYTRTDFAAIRAYVQRLPISTIANSFYAEDSPQVDMGLEKFLIQMRNDLIERAIEHNPHFAETLKNARQGGSLTLKALDILIKTADAPKAVPKPSDHISKWIRPKTAWALKQEGIITLDDLIKAIKRRGPGWWRSIPRVGSLRARILVKWINSNAITLGEVNVAAPLPNTIQQLVLDPNSSSTLIPVERMILPSNLDGSKGLNRCASFCFIQAKNDLDALLAYLTRFTDQPHTYRSYRKELERFLLWSVMVRRKPMSSLLVEDCQEYMNFLLNPSENFKGPKVERSSTRWKPFSDQKMNPASQKRAVIVLRGFFKYLTDVRYLSGNPWIAIKDPSVTKPLHAMKIHRALDKDLWEKFITFLTNLACEPKKSQERIALCAFLLMGDSGLRRHEVVIAQRNKITRYEHKTQNIYALEIIGKGNKERLVPVNERTINALRAHWHDHGLNFDTNSEERPLLLPLVIPRHSKAIKKHDEQHRKGYSADGMYPLIKRVWKKFGKLEGIEEVFSHEELDKLVKSSPHAFRHTFATLATESNMPPDVIQEILGHASIATTSIYNRSKEKRIMSEAAKFFAPQT